MAIYVLIHGGLHGGWCWDKVVPLLQKNGHTVEAPDLPGHGKDKTPIQDVTLQSCVDKVCSIINDKSEPVILVGHSISGIVISKVADQIPDKIRTLVFLTADLYRSGESLTSLFESFRYMLNISNDQRSYTIKEEFVDIMYNDCSSEEVARARSLLDSESIAFFKGPYLLSNERFGRVPRIYLECLRDKALSLKDQRAMYTATPCLKVLSLNTGHSPFLSAPEKLVDCLLSIADLRLSR